MLSLFIIVSPNRISLQAFKAVFKLFVKIEYVSLVNILLDKKVVPELIQLKLKRDNIRLELNNLILRKDALLEEYDKLIDILGDKSASKNAAQYIITFSL